MSAISTRASDLETQYRHGEVFKLRIAGHSFDEIAAQLGYRNRSGPFLALKRDLESHLLEPAEEYRQMELARLDAIWKPLFDSFQKQTEAGGDIDLKLVDRLLNCVTKQAAVAGLLSVKPTPGQQAPQAAISREEQITTLLETLRARKVEQATPMQVVDHVPNGTH